MMKKIGSIVFAVLLFASFARAQKAEVTIQLNEPFFDALLDAIFKNPNPPSFPIAEISPKSKVQSPKSEETSSKLRIENSNSLISSFADNKQTFANQTPQIDSSCDESIKLQREIDGVRTAVRFRDGKIYAPIAFSGNYNPPFIGCVEFSGSAETNIELSFDREKQALVGYARVTNVILSGTNGIGSSLVTKLVQSSIDKKMNPLQILPLDKISFAIPIQNVGTVKMKAVGINPEISGNLLNIHINYEFEN